MKEIDVHGKKLNVPNNFGDIKLPNHGYFSHSQFNMYKRCPRQFEYRYILNIRQPPGIAATQGSVLHVGAEKTHQHTLAYGNPLPLEKGESIVADEFETRKDQIIDWEDFTPGVIKDVILAHYRVYHTQAVPLIRPKAAEEAFAVNIGSVPVLGFIDLIDEVMLDREKDVLVPGEGPLAVEIVSDLKFTGRKWPAKKLQRDTQLTLYSHVKGLPRVRVDFLLNLKSGPRYTQERSMRTPNDTRLLVEDFEETADLVKRGIFPRCHPTDWCCDPKFCGYYERCRGPK